MPLLSVIMPVYNAELYLREAIDSILNQTFTDFELLVINDGSTDGSEKIILSYKDDRIVYIQNGKNIGLIATLNKAIDLSKGRFIARMDSDDISFPDRFAIQLQYFRGDATAQMVCSPIIGITPAGKLRDHWPSDINNRSTEDIFKTLPHENCISHPTVMIKSETLRKYRYSADQKGSEDWDLWLRLARDKVKIIKTEEVLVKYRIHHASSTQQHNEEQSPQLKSAIVKWKFVSTSLKRFKANPFVLKTFVSIFRDFGYQFKTRTASAAIRKTKRTITISPFTALKQFNVLKRLLDKNESRYFLFFPYSHLGGAEKVHAQITQLIGNKKPFVFITGIHDKNSQIDQFGSSATTIRIGATLYHPLFSAHSEKLIVAKIKATKNPIVFGANNYFFDRLVLRIPESVHVADLTHDINYRSFPITPEYIKSILRCNERVFISNKAVEKTLSFYDEHFIDDHFKERIKVIYNYVDQPENLIVKNWQQPFKILYVGRDTAEKAVDRIFELAALEEQRQSKVQFVLVGDIKQRAASNNVQYHGVVLDQHRLSQIYSECHFILITSVSEGFPLSLMEGMSHGCIPIATAVGDIPYHIKNNKNGYLVTSDADTATKISLLLKTLQSQDLASISAACVNYTKQHFSKETFITEYSEVFKL